VRFDSKGGLAGLITVGANALLEHDGETEITPPDMAHVRFEVVAPVLAAT
jgi:hypothetical protein